MSILDRLELEPSLLGQSDHILAVGESHREYSVYGEPSS
jgi:hypothetical protein